METGSGTKYSDFIEEDTDKSSTERSSSDYDIDSDTD